MSLANNLVAHYRCYDTTDEFRPAFPATLHNNLVISQVGTDAKCGSYLDGSGGAGRGNTFEIAPVPYQDPSNIGAFSFAAWVKNPYTGASNTVFLNGSHHFPMAIDGAGDVFFFQQDLGLWQHPANFNIRSLTNDNQWHRLVITIYGDPNGTGPYGIGHWAKYYIDGVHVGEATLRISGAPLSHSAKWINGGDPASFNDVPFEQITDIAIWRRILDIAEIEELSSGCLHNILNPSSANLSDASGFASEQTSFSLTKTNASRYWWSWVSAPSGSSVGNEAAELPNGTGVHNNFDMTNAEIHVKMDIAGDALAPGQLLDWTGYPAVKGGAWDTSRFGTINGATQVAGKVGDHAYEFDGTDTITFGQNLLYTTEDFTFSLWVKPAAAQPNNWCSIFSAHKTGPGTGYYLIQNGSNNNEYTFVGNPNGSYHPWNSSINLTPDVWSHVVITRVGTNIKMYVNGILTYDDPNDCAATIEYGTGNPLLTLGGYDGNGAWVGSIDYFVSWSRALSYDEVRDLYFMQSGDGAIANGNQLFHQVGFQFTPDIEGDYVMSIDIGGGVEATATATIDAFPSAGIIPDVTGYTGGGGTFIAPVTINPQYYTWQFQSVPAGSSVSTSPVSGDNYFMFTPDVEGTYTVQLEVYPGATTTANAVIELMPEAIVSNAAVDGFVNESITFDGSTSVNPQYYTWTWQSVPAGSSIAGSSTGSDTLTFTPDVEGTYITKLEVGPGGAMYTTATANVEIRPAVSISDRFIEIGENVTLSGAGSQNPSYYSWSVISSPSDSSINSTNTTGSNITFNFMPDVIGEYIVKLQIDDDISGQAVITVIPQPPKLLSGNYELRFAQQVTNQRKKRVAQVPFCIGTRSSLSIRKSNDSDFEDS